MNLQTKAKLIFSESDDEEINIQDNKQWGRIRIYSFNPSSIDNLYDDDENINDTNKKNYSSHVVDCIEIIE